MRGRSRRRIGGAALAGGAGAGGARGGPPVGGRRGGRIVGIALAAVAAAGCAKGPVNGRVAMPGHSESALTMSWESGLFGESGPMAAALPDGERFRGTYQVVRAGIDRRDIPAAWSGDEPAGQRGVADGAMRGGGA